MTAQKRAAEDTLLHFRQIVPRESVMYNAIQSISAFSLLPVPNVEPAQ